MEDLFWVAKISNTYLGYMKFLIIFGVNGRCWAPSLHNKEKKEYPLPWSLSISSNLSLLNAYKWGFVLVGFCPSGLLS